MKTGYNFEKSPRSHCAKKVANILDNFIHSGPEKGQSILTKREKFYRWQRQFSFNPLNLLPTKRRDRVVRHYICLYMVKNHKDGYSDINVS